MSSSYTSLLMQYDKVSSRIFSYILFPTDSPLQTHIDTHRVHTEIQICLKNYFAALIGCCVGRTFLLSTTAVKVQNSDCKITLQSIDRCY